MVFRIFLFHLSGGYDSVEDIAWESLPSKFIIKANHGSNANYYELCSDKNSFDIESAKMKMGKGETGKARTYIDNSMKIVMCLSFAMFFGIAAVAEVFSPVFWGDEFAECAILISFLSVITPIKAFANVLRTQYLIPNKIDRGYVVSVCCGAVVNLILNLLFIPRLKSLGAVIGTIGAEISVCIVVALYSWKELPIAKYIKAGLIYIPFGIAMYIPVYLIGKYNGTNIITLAVQIIVGVLIYGTLCLTYFFYKKVNPFYDYILGLIKRMKKISRALRNAI